LKRECIKSIGSILGRPRKFNLLVYSYDKIHNVRKSLVEALKKEFPDYGLT
jgi:hypothetical protein